MNKPLRRENIEKLERFFGGEQSFLRRKGKEEESRKIFELTRVPNQKRGGEEGKMNTKLFRGKRQLSAILPLSISVSPFLPSSSAKIASEVSILHSTSSTNEFSTFERVAPG